MPRLRYRAGDRAENKSAGVVTPAVGPRGPVYLPMTDEPTTVETREEAAELFDPSTEWENYGDLNPDMHGGRWVRYHADRGVFHVVETTHLADVNSDMAESYDDPGEQYVTTYTVDMDDIFTEEGGFTDTMQKVVDQFQHPPETPEGVLHGDGLTYYVVDFGFFWGIDGEIERMDSYGAVLDRYGVEPAESDNSKYD